MYNTICITTRIYIYNDLRKWWTSVQMTPLTSTNTGFILVHHLPIACPLVHFARRKLI